MKKRLKRNIFTLTRLKLDLYASLFVFFILATFSYLVYSLLTQDIIYQISPVFKDDRIAYYVDVDELFKNFRDQTLFLLIISDLVIFSVSIVLFDRLVKRMFKPLEYISNVQKSFAENLSHELRTPLAIINMNGELMSQKLTKEKEALKGATGFQNYTNNILEETNNISTLIEDLLFEARIKYEENKIEFLTLLDLEKILNKSLEDLKYLKREDVKLEIVNNFDNKEKAEKKIKASEIHLRRIFNNIISNSFKFTPSGEIRIILEKYKKDRKEYLKIKFEDTGVGINKKDLQKIGERFFRGKNIINSVAGSGVGLSIVKELISNYKWGFKVKSKEGSWTKIDIFKILIS